MQLTINMKRGIKRNRNRQQKSVVFYPYQAAFNYNVEIDYSS